MVAAPRAAPAAGSPHAGGLRVGKAGGRAYGSRQAITPPTPKIPANNRDGAAVAAANRSLPKARRDPAARRVAGRRGRVSVGKRGMPVTLAQRPDWRPAPPTAPGDAPTIGGMTQDNGRNAGQKSGQDNGRNAGRDRFGRATGRDAAGWVAWLDERGARELPHPDIATLAAAEIRALRGPLEDGAKTSNPDWWAQHVTVHYEQHIGRRAVGQRCDGDWSASASKTVPGDMTAARDAFAAHIDGVLADRGGLHPDADGLPVPADADPTISDTDTWRYWRVPLADGSRVTVNVQTKAPGKDGAIKSTVAVNHDSLADEATRDRSRTFWRETLGAFAETLG